MKTLFRNFIHTFRRLFAVNLLNILCLSVAFASFFIIMTQVDYDYNYNKCYKDYNNIYCMNMQLQEHSSWNLSIPRPMGEFVDSLSPHIKAGSLIQTFSVPNDYEVNDHFFTEPTQCGIGDFLSVFQPDMVEGNTKDLDRPNQCVIPESMAKRFFGKTDVVGQVIYLNKKEDNQPKTICGVYKDFPKNGLLGNQVFLPLADSINKGEWQNLNYNYYLRTDGNIDPNTFGKAIVNKLGTLMDDIENYSFKFKFTPLPETHFNDNNGTKNSNSTTMYFLICSAFLIILIAGINYMNFSLAETPLRIKGINTQKVLGASSAMLQRSLVCETILVSLTAALLGIFWVHLIQYSPLSDIVEARINFYEHPYILFATIGISVLIGILAGIYPAHYVTSFPPALVLKGSFGLSPRGKIMRTTLVCMQFIISFILTIFVFVMLLQSHHIMTSDYGFDKDNIIMGEVTNEMRNHSDAVTNDIKQIPGVTGVAYSLAPLSSADNYMSWGRQDNTHKMNFECIPVDYNFLNVMGIKITQGRGFRQGDGDVYVFNEAARKIYPWLEIDKDILTGDDPVIGFCKNVQFTSFRVNCSQIPMAFIIYGNKRKGWEWKATINIRVADGADKTQILKKVREVMSKYTPGHEFKTDFTNNLLGDTYTKENIFIKQMFLFSLLTIFISIVGVLGLTMFESEYRRKEIGIRKVMGSSTREILLMFNKRYQFILIGCFIIAAPLAYYLSSRWLQDFADHTQINWWVFLASYILLTILTITTVTLQSWKNANANPTDSIKTE